MMRLLNAQARYGEIHNGVWGNERDWCIIVPIPEDIGFSWVNTATKMKVSHIYCNKDIAVPMLNALQNLKREGILNELRTFDGAFCIRDTRGIPGQPSAHSWGAAIDLNAFENPLGKSSILSPTFVKCWIKEGFYWGGNFRRCDGMHFSWLGF